MKKAGEYGRHGLTLWNSPLFPEVKIQNTIQPSAGKAPAKRRLPLHNQRPANQANKPKVSKGFLDSQITAIVWILSRLLGKLPKLKKFETAQEKENRRKLRGPRYGGAILADSMGLGKTLTTISTMEFMAAHDLNVEINPLDGNKMHCPILILCPNVTVTSQWCRAHHPKLFETIIVSGGDSKHFPTDDRVCHISSSAFNSWPIVYRYVWDMSNPRASRTVMVMPIDTWSQRTCYLDDAEEPEWHSRFAEAERFFSIVCVDEAHRIKNPATKAFASIKLLEKQHLLLITATPCTNNLTDLLGPAHLLWPAASQHLRSKPKILEKIGKMESLGSLKVLDTLEPHDDLRLAAGKPGLLKKLLYRGRRIVAQNIEDTREYLRFFESLAMIKRGPGSIIFEDWKQTKPVSLDGLFPDVENSTINIELDQALAPQYQCAHANLLIEYFELLEHFEAGLQNGNDLKSKVANDDLKFLVTISRQWQIAAASMDVFKIDRLFDNNGFGTKAKHISQMRNAGVTFIQLAEFLLGPRERVPDTALGFLKVAVRGSPVLRYILHDLKNNVLHQRREGKILKLLITESVPMLAYYYELLLQFIGINCRCFHSDLSQDQRKEVIASFNDDSDDSVQVLIQMYTVGFAGSNLHRSCSRAIVASQAHSIAVQSQAVHRIIRVGQMHNVSVIRLKVKNSYHIFRESRQIEKLLPELGARAQGEVNEVLVRLLNMFQYEVDDAWNSEAGQNLVKSKSLILPHEVPASEHAAKRQRLSATKTRLRARAEELGWRPENSHNNENSDYNDLEEFLALKPRRDYYDEFKNLPRTKSHFDHGKNQLRRLLSFRRMQHDGITQESWTLTDLNDPAVLERALELMLRVRLGAENIEMLPYPHINFYDVPENKLKKLRKKIAYSRIIEQDLDAMQGGAHNASKDANNDDTTRSGRVSGINTTETTTSSDSDDSDNSEDSDNSDDSDDSDNSDQSDDNDDNGNNDDDHDGNDNEDGGDGYDDSEDSNGSYDHEKEGDVFFSDSEDNSDDGVQIVKSNSQSQGFIKGGTPDNKFKQSSSISLSPIVDSKPPSSMSQKSVDTNEDEVSIIGSRSLASISESGSMNKRWGDDLEITGVTFKKRDFIVLDDSDDEVTQSARPAVSEPLKEEASVKNEPALRRRFDSFWKS